MILDSHGQELGTFDSSGVHLVDGESFHFEHGPFDDSLVNDANPAEATHFEELPNGDTAVLDPNYDTIAVVRRGFGL